MILLLPSSTSDIIHYYRNYDYYDDYDYYYDTSHHSTDDPFQLQK